MKLHPSFYLFISCLLFSIIMALSSDSFFMLWLTMELNMLFFIPLMLHKSLLSTESSLKYFLSQSIASVLIFMSILPLNLSSLLEVLMISLLIKLGAAPCHQWLISMVGGLGWPSLFFLLTAQKIIPLMALSMTTPFISNNLILTLSLTLSALMGSMGGLVQPSLRKIMTFSSIAHMSWMLLSSTVSDKLWSLYLILYSLISFFLIFWFSSLSLSSISQMLSKSNLKETTLISFNLLSLGGLPPFTGFLPKLMTMQLVLTNSSKWLIIPSLIGTFISLGFYLRLTFYKIIYLSSMTSSFLPPNLTTNKWVSFNMLGLLGPSVLVSYM